ncbi:nucleotidyltransferase domain-containing protein [Kineococcus sp. G2]|uniref:nucleotidyltransferase domain-containing protein n=1 Tax=Kineococcus sp. G2 TaxID=3127484 RepID=UPI00301BBA39
MHQHLPDDRHLSLACFGSFARGEAGADSDTDLLLVVPDGTADDTTDRIVGDLEVHGRRWTGNEVQVRTGHRLG